jgi:hypothetical protein
MHRPDINPMRIRTQMGFQREVPLSGVYIMRGGAVGGQHLCTTNPSYHHPSSPRNPSQARGASTPMTGVPTPYCVSVVLIGRIRRRSCEP